ncbi:aminotransferase-like domain-containing protein (plasmid) [Rhizobium leguminosarum]|jgi:DNA-binding transcriptional MocR family regulator|uniref:GntR family transcriptional regulator n=3 Tax=Rhizobium TaxID=379 RepID=A0A1B8RHV9_RHILT|nr:MULTISPECIES: PLP-dependent aminotransferase family protein [Rhizobium]AOO88528.1 GntR family transcriptional regulator [Rhizobium leguminosarum bv. trifolii]ASS58734.1 PLP-dependent aminotransferase family protein [Rhizobium leguminosarum bv. viciae]MBB4330492.1 DNA-binding transcriptional MocR family regulator [Rhizobium leguminosarum]MBB4339643.1 DNA-binding transcriptional MocR family regulator [Rhizobium leguminosarum]MBB4355672.1 DNA-binding transcriptional MocR family regulator [Rhiz
MGDAVEASWFAEKIADRSIRGIALETSALIRAGVLPIGTRLPAIRDIAYELHVSPATISEAWSELRRQKIISGRGRNGTWVSGDRFVAKPERLASSGNYREGVLDLTLAGPDAALLPRLAEAMAYGASVDDLNSYERSRIVPELKDAVSERWPYEAEAFLATNGGYNAVYTILHALVSSGSAVAIEHPTAMRLLDILEDLGVKIIPVACDGEGPLPDSLREALRQRPAAFLFQPRLHSVTGVTVSSSRLDQLGDVLEDSDTLVIEDDGVGDVSAAPPQSLGGRFAERTIHILSLSKSLGPDLRLAVLSSSAPIVDQIQSYRSFSAGWTSRILQSAAAWLLRDPATWQLIGEAREIYQQRRDALAEALSERGIPIPPGQGLCLWVPVVSEPFAMVTLAARNIAVNPGNKFSVLPSSHIRVATSTLSDRCEEAADAIALAHAP